MSDTLHFRAFVSSALVYLFVSYGEIPLINARPAYSNESSIYSSSNAIGIDKNTTIVETIGEYVFSDDFCDNSTCREMYQQVGYPYEEIKALFSGEGLLKIGYSPLDICNNCGHQFSITSHTSTYSPKYSDPISGYDGLPESSQAGASSIPSLQRGMEMIPHGYAYDTGLVLESTVSCIEISRPHYLFINKDVNGKLYYIANVDVFKQRLIVKTCESAEAQCGDGSTPEGYIDHCKQEYEFRDLVSIPAGKKVTKSSLVFAKFKIASGCVCKRTRKDRVFSSK